MLLQALEVLGVDASTSGRTGGGARLGGAARGRREGEGLHAALVSVEAEAQRGRAVGVRRRQLPYARRRGGAGVDNILMANKKRKKVIYSNLKTSKQDSFP